MSATIPAAGALVKVLEDWGVDHLYGIPGGSFNSTMDGLYHGRDRVKYIQVRHEETGALAAAVDAKLTGRIGVCFGSAGPGATHLFNGLYDAKMDHAPVLALVGQVASTAMNTDAFQELNENPMFTDVSVYNRTVMTPASLPGVVDEAIRRALEARGVAVVTVPVDFGSVAIPDRAYANPAIHHDAPRMPDARDVDAAARLLARTKRPVLYFGVGARGAGREIVELSRKLSMPVISSVLAKGIIPDMTENYMGTAARVASKPANEALAASDCILFIGSDFPFARAFFPEQAKFIQIDIDSATFGRRHRTDVAILGDARMALRMLIEAVDARAPGDFYTACRANMAEWRAWLKKFATSRDVPLRVEPVFREINRIAERDAVFVTDVGNCTIDAVRLLDMNGDGQAFTTSGWFATMGYGVPGGIAAKLSHPGRQVFTLNGDGGFAMAMQDIITQVKYNLPVINVVFSNNSLGFIEAEQEDTGQARFGVDLQGADYALAAKSMGAVGVTVTKPDDLPRVFDEAAASAAPVVIDVRIANERPFPAEAMKLDPARYGAEEITAFRERYRAQGMRTLRDFFAQGPDK